MNEQQNQPSLLGLGICSLIFSVVVGIILGAIGRKKGKAYVAAGGELTGASKVGFILCKVGLILSIIGTIAFVIYMIVLIVAGPTLISAAAKYYY